MSASRRRPLWGFIAITIAITITLLWTGRAHARPPVLDRERIEALKADVAHVLAEHHVPGVGIALVTANDGVVWAGGVGLADRESRRPVEADTLFRVGSITKSFVALTVLRLVERGALDLDVPISRYAPDLEIQNEWAATDPITLAHVLEHTAGFDDMRFNESGGPTTPDGMAPAEALAINPRSRIARWRPGSRFAYANPGTTVAAYAIERVTGLSFEAAVRREVLEPLGMDRAGFRRTPAVDRHLAQGYHPSGYTASRYWITPHRPAGHLIASPRELGRLVHMFLRRGELDEGRLVSASSVLRMERSETRTQKIDGFSYGLGNHGDPNHPVPGRGHDGGLPGFISSYRYFADLGVGYVILFNTTGVQGALPKVSSLVFDALTEGMKLPEPPRYQPTPEALERFVGGYEFVSPRHEVFGFIERVVLASRVERHGDRLELYVEAVPRPIPLTPTRPNEFTAPGFSGSIVRFDPDERTMLLFDHAFVRVPSWYGPLRANALRIALRLMVAAILVWIVCLGFARFSSGLRASVRVLAAPAVASLSLCALPVLFGQAATAEVLGQVHPWTVSFFLCSLLAAAATAVAIARAIRTARRPWPLWSRGFALAVSIACFIVVLWLRSAHIIGLRTWAW